MDWDLMLAWGVVIGVGLVLGFALREKQTSNPDSPIRQGDAPSLKSWALNGLCLGGMLGAVLAGMSPNKTDPFFVRALVLAPVGALVGAVIAAVAYAVMRAAKGTLRIGKAAAPLATGVAMAAGRAGVDAIASVRKSSLEKRLAEIDRLHAAGAITAEERATARSAALVRE